jgi:hypothetical protein
MQLIKALLDLIATFLLRRYMILPLLLIIEVLALSTGRGAAAAAKPG